MRLSLPSVAIVVSVTGSLFAANPNSPSKPAASAAFENAVKPMLSTTCAGCHNDRLSSGGLNIAPFTAPASISENREGWERILQKVRTGEMPPKGIPRLPAAQVD